MFYVPVELIAPGTDRYVLYSMASKLCPAVVLATAGSQSGIYSSGNSSCLFSCLFSVCGIGWVDKAVLFPLMKACFANSMNEREIKTLLASTSLMSLVCLFVGQITVDL